MSAIYKSEYFHEFYTVWKKNTLIHSVWIFKKGDPASKLNLLYLSVIKTNVIELEVHPALISCIFSLCAALLSAVQMLSRVAEGFHAVEVEYRVKDVLYLQVNRHTFYG